MKSRIIQGLIGVVTLMLVIVLLSSMTMPASAELEGWQYQKEITIRENSGVSLTDYQVLLDLSSSNFPVNAKSDGADIRFINAEGNELSYWIEEFNPSAKRGMVWVKVPSIPANGETKIKMYYGNPSASAVSDGDKVFEFFDDFNSDLSKWINFGGTGVTIESGRLKIFHGDTDHPYVKTVETFNRGVIIEVDVETTSVSGIGSFPNIVGYGLSYGNIGASPDVGAFVTAWYGNNKWGIWDMPTEEGSTIVSASFSTNHIYIIKFYVKQNEYYADIDDGAIAITRAGTHTSKEVILGMQAHYDYHHYHSTTYFDNVRVRKYASPEPAITISSEMPTPTPTAAPSATPTPASTPVAASTLGTLSMPTPEPTPISTPKPKTAPTPTLTLESTAVSKPSVTPTATPTQEETPTPLPSPSVSIPPLYIIGAAIIVILLIAGIGISRRGRGGSSESMKPQPPIEPQPPAEPLKPKPEAAKPEPIIEPAPVKKLSIDVSSAFGYKRCNNSL